jgi:hypothetical protein
LTEAGVTRPELHAATPERMALRAHDLRGSFVTIAFANGRSESWVADRTGHRSSQMLARYKRPARTAADVGLGDWTPLDVALGLAKRSTPPGAPKRGTPSRARRGAPSRVGQRVGQKSAPDTIRTYDLGFRKARVGFGDAREGPQESVDDGGLPCTTDTRQKEQPSMALLPPVADCAEFGTMLPITRGREAVLEVQRGELSGIW